MAGTIVALDTGLYRLINVGANLPIKREDNYVNAQIVTGMEDYSDDYKWIITNINEVNTYTIEPVEDELYLFYGKDITSSALVVASTEKQYVVLKLVPGSTDTFTIRTLDGNIPLAMESDVPGARLIASVKPRKGKKQHNIEYSSDNDVSQGDDVVPTDDERAKKAQLQQWVIQRVTSP